MRNGNAARNGTVLSCHYVHQELTVAPSYDRLAVVLVIHKLAVKLPHIDFSIECFNQSLRPFCFHNLTSSYLVRLWDFVIKVVVLYSGRITFNYVSKVFNLSWLVCTVEIIQFVPCNRFVNAFNAS